MASALAIVALAGWLQWFSVSMGVTPKAYTENVDCADRETGSVMGGVEIECLAHTALGRLPTEADEKVWTLPIPSPQEPSHLDLYLYTEDAAPLAQRDSAVPVTDGDAGSIPAGGRIAPAPVATVAAASVGQLSEEQAIDVLQAAGWPSELIPQALAVAWCESKWSPGASGDSGRSRGWFQLNVATWFPYADEDPAMWADPLVNARVAWATYNYDLSRGQRAWQQWSCRSAVY